MFKITDDLSIYVTRGDTVYFLVTAEENGENYIFKPGEVVRIKVFTKKDCKNVVLQKDFPVTKETDSVQIILSEQDTKIGEVISKPVDYWYEVELNPFTSPQTIIGYDDEGAKIFKLHPEGDDIPEFEPDPEDVRVIDTELDMTSTRPVQNQAIARNMATLKGDFAKVRDFVTEQCANTAAATAKANSDIEVERARIDNLVSGATADGAEVVDIRVGADGVTYESAGTAVREQIKSVNNYVEGEHLTLLCEGVAGTSTSTFAKVVSGNNVLKVVVGDSASTAMKFTTNSGKLVGGVYIEPNRTYYVSVSGDVKNAWTAIDAEANYSIFLVNNPSVALGSDVSDMRSSLGITGVLEIGSMVNGLYEWKNGRWTTNGWATRLATELFQRKSINLTVECDFENGYQCSIVAYRGNTVIVDTGWNTSARTITANECDGFYALVKRVVNGSDVNITTSDATGLVITEHGSQPVIATKKDIENIFKDTGNIHDKIKAVDARHNPLHGKKYYAHLFMDTIWADKEPVFPSQSVFDIDCAKRLGFNIVEGNVHKTADGKYIVMHGVDGTLGWQVKTVNDEWASGVVIADTAYDDLRNNYRYRSKYEKYRTSITSLEEFLLECKKQSIVPFIQYVDDTMLQIVKNIVGDDFILYQATREKYDGMIYLWGNASATKEQILSICDNYGAPFMYGLADPTSYTDAELREIVDGVHQRGCLIGWAGCYCTPETNKKLLDLGFDFSGSGWDVNEFETGNLLNAKGDIDYSDFSTTGTVENSVLMLNAGDTVTVEELQETFLAKGSLHIVFDGAITLSMGSKINTSFVSDGFSDSWFSTYFMEEEPVFTITANDATRILSIDYKVSKC